ncbi:MAG TPA: SRPBCC family protein [Opitutaceae bacterium]|nr:SRPBCC family protein [Opitutaceae bacterium]
MLKKILLGLAVAIVVFCIIVAFQPAEYRVVRTASIAAPPAVVFSQVNDFHRWDAWSPWAKLDPNMKTTHAGPAAGKGAVYTWTGNSDVGEGRMTILESQPSERVRIQLDFIKPFESSAENAFAFKGEGNQTAVTWTMTGHKNFLSKAVCMFMNMDKMVGGDFERGLAQLRTVAESAGKTPKA